MWLIIFLLFFKIFSIDSARILAIFPSACVSHHYVYRSVIHTLLDRGHQIVLITTFPENKKDESLKNLTEIDIQNISRELWADDMENNIKDGSHFDIVAAIKMAEHHSNIVLEKQLKTKAVQYLLNDKNEKFNFIIVESYARPLYYLSIKYNIPLLLLSSFGPPFPELMGASSHPVYYPEVLRTKFYNLTMWDTLFEVYQAIRIQKFKYTYDENANDALKILDSNAPGIDLLYDNMDIMIVNEHIIRELNRPVPLSLVYLYGTHIKPQAELPKDIQTYLDKSTHGVIYLSFGTSVSESQLPQDKIQAMLKVFSELPYDVLWKWNVDLPGTPKNVLVQKWFQQADILRHPKMKLFVTQGGLQSIDEAIVAGVPLLGIPLLFDQFGNIDKVVHFGCGKHLDIFTMTENDFKDTVQTVIGDDSYRNNVAKTRTLFYDQPHQALPHFVWWTNYVLRFGARHLRCPAANMSFTDYFELELVLSVVIFVLLVLILVWIIVKRLVTRILRMFRTDKVKNF